MSSASTFFRGCCGLSRFRVVILVCAIFDKLFINVSTGSYQVRKPQLPGPIEWPELCVLVVDFDVNTSSPEDTRCKKSPLLVPDVNKSQRMLFNEWQVCILEVGEWKIINATELNESS